MVCYIKFSFLANQTPVTNGPPPSFKRQNTLEAATVRENPPVSTSLGSPTISTNPRPAKTNQLSQENSSMYFYIIVICIVNTGVY